MLAILKDSVFFINIVFALIVLFLERKRPMYTLFWITLLLLTSYLGFLAYLVFALIVLFLERKRPMYTLFWITLLLLTSYLGFLAYLFFGLKFYKRRKVKKFYSRTFFKELYKSDNYKVKLVEKRNQLTNYISTTIGNKVTYYNTVCFFKEGNSFFEGMLRDIENAKETINMEYYIFSDDKLGGKFYDLLEKKSKEGVKIKIIVDGIGTRKLKRARKKSLKIKIIVDGIGTRKLKRARKKSLKESGVELKVFFPSNFPLIKIGNIRANYRDHRKICVIDSLIAYTGGFNIGDEYIGNSDFGKWRDTGARIEGEASVDIDRKICVIDSLIAYTGGFNIGDEYIGNSDFGKWRDTGARIEGEASVDIEREFYIMWSFLQKKHLDYVETDKVLRKKVDIIYENFKKYDVNAVQLISSGPNYENRTIRDSYIKMIMEAKRSIYIESPYFVPDDLLLDCLRIALASGIEVKIIIPDLLLDCLRIALASGIEVKIIIPDKPDHPFVYWANQNFSIELFERGAEIYKYNGGFLHSKMLIIDNEIASFGSSNFDYRSLYQNFEINYMIYDIELIGYLRQLFFEDLSNSEAITKMMVKERGIMI